jgi:hypothetical protein
MSRIFSQLSIPNPYDGIQKYLKKLKPDIALLPINGRDDYRLSHNSPGNFHFEEADFLGLDMQ